MSHTRRKGSAEAIAGGPWDDRVGRRGDACCCAGGAASLPQAPAPSLPDAALLSPPPPTQLNQTALITSLNTTKHAIKDQVDLKLTSATTFDASAPRFVGRVVCFLDDATGDVVGLQMGWAPPLCSRGTPRSFAVPSDAYLADIKVAVDKETDQIGELVFIVKTNGSPTPTSIFSCGKKGGLPVTITPPMSAVSRVSAACKPASQGGRRRRLAQGSGLALDPGALSVVATAVDAGVSVDGED